MNLIKPALSLFQFSRLYPRRFNSHNHFTNKFSFVASASPRSAGLLLGLLNEHEQPESTRRLSAALSVAGGAVQLLTRGVGVRVKSSSASASASALFLHSDSSTLNGGKVMAEDITRTMNPSTAEATNSNDDAVVSSVYKSAMSSLDSQSSSGTSPPVSSVATPSLVKQPESTNNNQGHNNNSTTSTTSTTSAHTNWRGHLIARILPIEYTEFDVKKPLPFRLDDIQTHHLTRQLSSVNNNRGGGDENDKTFTNKRIHDYDETTTTMQESFFPNGEVHVQIDLYLQHHHQQQQEEEQQQQQSIKAHIHMNRDADELIPRTIQRLQLSTFKKIETSLRQYYKAMGLEYHTDTKKKKRKKNKRNTKNMEGSSATKEVSSLSSSSSSLPIQSSYFYKTNNQNKEAMEETEKKEVEERIATDQMQNIDFWKMFIFPTDEELLQKQIKLSISNTTSSQSRPSSSSSISISPIDIISCPPTILKVNVFENFEAELYVNVPIVVQVEMIYANYAEMSWFVNGELTLEDSPHFIPTLDHVGKEISILLVPKRKKKKNDDHYYHDGQGYEEAYRFANHVKNLPIMPIVSPLRDEFNRRKSSLSSTTMNTKDNDKNQRVIRVLTYNILADLYASRDDEQRRQHQHESIMYPHCKSEHLHKRRRMPMILSEILAYHADIICLQEVDGSIYDSFLQPSLASMGYEGYYSNKVSLQREGCAMFWLTTKFDVSIDDGDIGMYNIRDLFHENYQTLTKEEGEEDVVVDNADGKSRSDKTTTTTSSSRVWKSQESIIKLLQEHDELREVTMEKIGQILQVATLNIKGSSSNEVQKIVVANTHLFYHPMADHIRLLQSYITCKKIDEIRRIDHNNNNNNAANPLILCGDLNSDPLSGAAQLLFTRSVLPEHRDCWKHLHEYKWDMGETEYMTEHGYVGNEEGCETKVYEDEAFDDAKEEEENVSNSSSSDDEVKPPPIILSSCFPNLISGCEEMPAFTNYAVDFVETLDYILASEPSKLEKFGFRRKSSAPMPTSEDVKKYVAMPNEFMPSDHTSIVCDLELIKYNDNDN